ncbi:unnamed protein product [Merluccius merluccius]
MSGTRESEERKLCAHPYVEVYSEGRVQYMVPLARQGDFYVPELRPSERRISAGEDSGSADSNSEYSSGSGVLLCDSREASAGRSSPFAHSQSREKWEGRSRERSSTATSFTAPTGEGRGGEGQAISAESNPDKKGDTVVVDGEE